MSQLRELEEAAIDESRDIKEIVSRIVPTYHIKPEDKKRDEESYEQLVSLGKASHEGPVVSTKEPFEKIGNGKHEKSNENEGGRENE